MSKLSTKTLIPPIILLAACVHQAPSPSAVPTVTVSQLMAAPEMWDGKRVRVQGWAVRSFEDVNLYASRAQACGNRLHPKVVGAEWDDGHFGSADRMRGGVFEGTFRNRLGVTQPDGTMTISTGQASPGPLEDIEVVRWTSPAEKACR